MNYLTPSAAKGMPGLRLVLSADVPGPWGEASKGLFHIRSVPYIPVAQIPALPNEDLVAWTGMRNAPIAVYNEETPRTSWLDILMLAERLGQGPSLLPEDAALRATCVGISHEICGTWGYGWCRRLMIFADLWADTANLDPEDWPPAQRRLATQYDYRPETVAAAPSRVEAILAMLHNQLESQKKAGSAYLVGHRLSAADIFWATFSAMLSPMPHALNPMPDYLRVLYTNQGSINNAAHAADLIAHRDFIYRTHLQLPLDF